MESREHWEQVYRAKKATEVSWYQAEPSLSLDLVHAVADRNARILDIGGGASLLVDRLVGEGFKRVAVLDIAAAALAFAKRRLGEAAQRVEWLEADITAAPDLGRCDVWHDRAVFHFLTSEADRRKYVDTAARTVIGGGHVIIATFSLDGPSRCSGLDVQRWDVNGLAVELGERFELVKAATEIHSTPKGKPQSFV